MQKCMIQRRMNIIGLIGPNAGIVKTFRWFYHHTFQKYHRGWSVLYSVFKNNHTAFYIVGKTIAASFIYLIINL